MEIEELMVGDYCRIAKDGLGISKGTAVRVLSIDGEVVFRGLRGCVSCRGIHDGDVSEGIWAAHLETIPLTREIIGRNFVKKVLYGIFEEAFVLEIHEISEGVFCVVYHVCDAPTPDQSVVVRFINELQHFLAHCKIKKEIEL